MVADFVWKFGWAVHVVGLILLVVEMIVVRSDQSVNWIKVEALKISLKFMFC